MRFVPIKTIEQQAALVPHRTRDQLVSQRTMLVNALRGHMAEFGIVARQGVGGVGELLVELREGEAVGLPGPTCWHATVRREFPVASAGPSSSRAAPALRAM